MKILLLSHRIDNNTPLYGGRKKVVLVREKSIKKGDSSNILRFSINTHTSTHIDMPYHFIRKGRTLTDYDKNFWVFDNVLIKKLNLKVKDIISPALFSSLQYDPAVDFLIIRTGFESFRKRQSYIKDSPMVLASTARFLKRKLPNLRAIGFDFISLSSLRNRQEGRKAHRAFLTNNILIIEDMKLSELTDKPDLALVSPLFIDRADASPVSIWAFYDDFDIHKYDYIFFDFDGVILDSVNIKTEAFREMYKKYGNGVSRKVVQHHLANGGMSRFEKFRLYHKRFLRKNLSDDEVEKLAEQFSRLVFKKVLKAGFIKGAEEFLKMCKSQSKKCFLVSSTPETEIKNIIKTRNLAKFFKSVKGSPAPKEKNIKDLIKKYRIDKRKTVFFGDSINDLKAAGNNNVKFIGINYGKPALNYRDFSCLLGKTKRKIR